MNRIIKFRIKKDITTPNKTTKSRCNQNQKKKKQNPFHLFVATCKHPHLTSWPLFHRNIKNK